MAVNTPKVVPEDSRASMLARAGYCACSGMHDIMMLRGEIGCNLSVAGKETKTDHATSTRIPLGKRQRKISQQQQVRTR
jgi:hypothetical protein